MSYYYEEEQDQLRRPSLGWRLLLIAAAIVPVLVSVFVIFWFIRAYISPPMVAVPPLTPAAQDAMDGPKQAQDTEMGQNVGASPGLSLPRSSGLPSSIATPTTRAPAAYADTEPGLSAPAAAAAPLWPPAVAASTTAAAAASTTAAAAAAADEDAALSPADAIATRSSSPIEKVPLPRRRPPQSMAAADPAAADPSAVVSGGVPLPRNRPPLAHDAPPAEAPVTSTERPDRNF